MKFLEPDRFNPCGLLLLLLVVPLQAENTLAPPTICTYASGLFPWWEGPAPTPPTLPEQYSMKVEANIIQNSWTTEVEEHYDSLNHRASVSLTRNGSTTVSIFNFKTNQRYDIYPNGTCLARPTEGDVFGFVTLNKQNRPTMATVNEVFRFGTKFNWTYVAKETVRGIPVNHWTSCQDWTELGAKFQLDYYFSDPDYTTASGEAEIPVRAELRGFAHNVDMSNDPINGLHTFQHIYEFTSFWAGPVLDEGVFQIPRGILCSGRTDNKPLPQIPGQLEMSIEVVRPDSGIQPRWQQLRCDQYNNVQETLTTNLMSRHASVRPTEGDDGQRRDYYNLVTTTSVVNDYNNDLAYITDVSTYHVKFVSQTSGTCNVQKMPLPLTMSHSHCLFAVTNNSKQFTYQGQTTFRAMGVDVWSMEQDSVITEVYFLPEFGANRFQIMTGIFVKNKTSAGTTDLPKILRDMFGSERLPEREYTSDRFQELFSSSSHSPAGTSDQSSRGLQLEQLVDQFTPLKIISIYNYQPLILDVTSFQISQCFPETEVSEVTLFVMANYDTEVLGNFLSFSTSIRHALAQKLGVSILHFSNFAVKPSKLDTMQQNATEVKFTLLGAANVSEAEQKSITEIRDTLIKTVSSGITIRVEYSTFSKDFMVHRDIYFIDDRMSEISNNENDTRLPTSSSERSTNVGSHITYTQGTVAGISVGSFALGTLLCLVVTIFVRRRKSVDELLVSHDTN